MIYIRMNTQVERDPNTPIFVTDIADVIADAKINVGKVKVQMPMMEGVYKTDAVQVIRAIKSVFPAEGIVLLGSASGLLIRKRSKEVKARKLRALAAFLTLMFGSALAIMWFHADVNMLDAQKELYMRLTGKAEPSMWLLAIPYAAGICIGVALSFSLTSKKRVSPIDIKLSEYKDALLNQRATQEDGNKS